MDRTSVICTVCERVVQTRIDQQTQEIEYRHIEPADHELQVAIVPEKQAKKICDFCSGSGPKWAFVPTEAYSHTFGEGNEYTPELDTPEIHKVYTQPWLCCDRCVNVVSQRLPGALVEHVCKTGRTGTLYQFASDKHKKAMRTEWFLVHSKFFNLGKPEGPFPLAEV